MKIQRLLPSPKKDTHCQKFSQPAKERILYSQDPVKVLTLCTALFVALTFLSLMLGSLTAETMNRENATQNNDELQKTSVSEIFVSNERNELNHRTTAADLHFMNVLLEHKSAADHAGQLFRKMFPDSKSQRNISVQELRLCTLLMFLFSAIIVT